MARPSVEEDLRNAVANAVAAAVKAYDVPEYCVSLGLASGEPQSAFASKRLYVSNRLPKRSEDVLPIADKVLARYPSFDLEEAIWRTREAKGRTLSELTRRAILDQLAMMMGAQALGGKLDLPQFLKRLWPLDDMPSSDYRFDNASEDFRQHTVLNDDWDVGIVFDRLDLLSCSEHLFLRFLEELLHPVARGEEHQLTLAAALNPLLARDGMELRVGDSVSGYALYRCVPKRPGVKGGSKNIIFAANGPKPEIVLRDAINNEVEIVKNAEYCLVFDRPIPATGLRIRDLAEWWAALHGGDPTDKELWRAIYRRMEESLGSPPERIMFRAYYDAKVIEKYGAELPALIPQVYLHFDPLTARERVGASPVARQRMDFLLLLSSRERIVIEVDGKQHYAEGDTASPGRYGAMMSEDRELRLAGYEVFRFGGSELPDNGGDRAAKEFFARLLAQRCPQS